MNRRQFLKFLPLVIATPTLLAACPMPKVPGRSIKLSHTIHDEIFYTIYPDPSVPPGEVRLINNIDVATYKWWSPGPAGREYHKAVRHARNYGMGPTRLKNFLRKEKTNG
jgi:hypothetical protein